MRLDRCRTNRETTRVIGILEIRSRRGGYETDTEWHGYLPAFFSLFLSFFLPLAPLSSHSMTTLLTDEVMSVETSSMIWRTRAFNVAWLASLGIRMSIFFFFLGIAEHYTERPGWKAKNVRKACPALTKGKAGESFRPKSIR